MISILYHIITKTATPLYQNCGFCLAEQSRFELYSLAVQVRLASLGLRPYACRWQATAGATLLASLESKLFDSAALRYLRPARLRLAAVRRWQILSSLPKRKNTEHPGGYSVFLAEKKGFEPSRRLPDLHP